MKLNKIIALLLLFPSAVFAQGWQIPPPAGTPRALATPGTTMNRANVDTLGNQQVLSVNAGGSAGFTPGTGATDLGKAEDASHVSESTGVMGLGVSQGALSVLVDALGEYVPQAISRQGTAFVSPRYDGTVPQTEAVIKREDEVAATAEALVGVAGVVNTGFAIPAANGDYAALTLGTWGQGLSTPVYDGNLSAAQQAVAQEDNVMNGGDAGVKILVQTQDPLTVDQGGAYDAGFLKTDRAGRTITTLAPAGEMWQSCTSPMTGTGDVSLKALVGSNRIYVTNLTCSNTAAVSSLIFFKDGLTTIYVGGVGNSTLQGVANYVNTLPVPLRLTSGTAFNVAMGTTATSTTCCASGYISVN